MHQGIAADVLKLLGERLDITLERQHDLSWEQVLTGARERTLDLVSICAMTFDRSKYLTLTSSFATQSWVIVTRKQFRHVENLKDIINDKVAMVKGYAVVELVQNKFPDLPIQFVETPLAGLNAVATGRLDAYVGDLGVVSYLIQEKNLGNLKIAGSGLGFHHLSIGVRSDWPELVTILNKGLVSISQEEMNDIRQKWIPVELEHAKVKKSTLTSLWQLIGAAVLIFLILFFLIRFLMKYSQGETVILQFGSRKFRILTIITLSFIVTVISFISWLTMKHNKEIVLKDVQANLETILKSTSERLDIWTDQQKILLKQLGRDPELLDITERLLVVPVERRALLFSFMLDASRAFFERKKEQFGDIGFSIVNSNYINIASKRNSNIGSRNFIAVQRPLLIEKVFQGETVFVPPIFSDVDLRDSYLEEDPKKTATMFFAAPIQNADGEIIAVIIQRVDPTKGFSKVMQFSRLGETGESYAFDQEGRLLSESRFYDQLLQIGLIKPGQQSILNIEIRDPGGNMVEGYQPKVPRSEQSFTLMASRAIQDQSGRRTEISPGDYLKIETDMKGYRDYRGVPVFGSWLWEEHLGVGLTVEIDVEEALSTYHTMRLTVLSILGVTLFLFVGTTLFTLISGERSNRALIRARDELEERVIRRTSELGEKKKELENKSDLLEAVVNSISQGLVAFDGQLRLIVCNKYFQEIRDVPEEYAQPGSSFEDWIRFDVKRGEFGSGDPEGHIYQQIAQAKQFKFHHFERTRPDGTVIEVSGGPLPSGGFVSTYSDITDRKKAEEALRKLSRAVEQSAHSIVITDVEGIIEYVNPAFCELTGYNSEEVIGQNTRILKSGKYHEAFYKVMWKMLTSGKLWKGEMINKKKNGEFYWELVTISPVKDTNGTTTHYVAIKEDISERKKMEEQLREAYQIIKSQKERMEGELSVGHEIQMSMLPLVFPPFPDRKEFDIYADLQPAREVGGDLYDFFFIDDEQLCFCVGDVSGKGVPAALFMAVTKTLIKSRASNDTSTASILTQVNEELSQNNKSCMFVTVFIGILNTKTGEIVYTNAGHNPPYIKRNNNSIECMNNRHGPVIGAVSGMAYKEDKTILKKGDVLLLFTDGVTEAMDPEENLFSEKRLTGLLSSRKFASVEDVVNTTIKEVKLFEGDAEQADDITILAIEFLGQPKGKPVQNLIITIRNSLSEIDKVNQRFNTFADHCGIPKPLCKKVNIIFDELLNNIISYAYNDNNEHDIIIELEFFGDRLSITITDDGIPFNPFEAKKPDTELSLEDREIGGLGIHLVRNLMDKVSYKRHIGKNVISLTKQIQV